MVTTHNFGRSFNRFVSVFVLAVFLVQTACPPNLFAQSVPGSSVPIAPLSLNSLTPVGLSLDPQNPFQFELLVDQGNAPSLPLFQKEGDGGSSVMQAEAMKLIKYFLASLTISEKDMWVNLSPVEPDRIVPPTFAQTAMGRDMLAQDYVLKQITSALMSPEGEAGKKFWDKIYAAAGTTDVPVETLNKVWIMPDKAVVYQNGHQAYVVESRLKVMLEEDYLLTQKSVGAIHELPLRNDTQNIIRQTILPVIEDEVNNGESFANLRQMYQAMILAYWFKQNLKKSLLGQVYVNKNKVTGVDQNVSEEINGIYQQYVAKFHQGAFDLIKEDYDPETQTTVARKYFSGGYTSLRMDQAFGVTEDAAMVQEATTDRAQMSITFRLKIPTWKDLKDWFSEKRDSSKNKDFKRIESESSKMFLREGSSLGVVMDDAPVSFDQLLSYRNGEGDDVMARSARSGFEIAEKLVKQIDDKFDFARYLELKAKFERGEIGYLEDNTYENPLQRIEGGGIDKEGSEVLELRILENTIYDLNNTIVFVPAEFAGAVMVLKYIHPLIRVIGVSANNNDGLYRSFEAGQAQEGVGQKDFEIFSRYSDGVLAAKVQWGSIETAVSRNKSIHEWVTENKLSQSFLMDGNGKIREITIKQQHSALEFTFNPNENFTEESFPDAQIFLRKTDVPAADISSAIENMERFFDYQHTESNLSPFGAFVRAGFDAVERYVTRVDAYFNFPRYLSLREKVYKKIDLNPIEQEDLDRLERSFAGFTAATVFLPIRDDGAAAAAIVALKYLNPKIKVIAVTSSRFDAMYRSFKAGQHVDRPSGVQAEALEILAQYADGIMSLNDVDDGSDFILASDAFWHPRIQEWVEENQSRHIFFLNPDGTNFQASHISEVKREGQFLFNYRDSFDHFVPDVTEPMFLPPEDLSAQSRMFLRRAGAATAPLSEAAFSFSRLYELSKYTGSRNPIDALSYGLGVRILKDLMKGQEDELKEYLELKFKIEKGEQQPDDRFRELDRIVQNLPSTVVFLPIDDQLTFASVLLFLKHVNPNIKVIGSSGEYNAMYDSFLSGENKMKGGQRPSFKAYANFSDGIIDFPRSESADPFALALQARKDPQIDRWLAENQIEQFVMVSTDTKIKVAPTTMYGLTVLDTFKTGFSEVKMADPDAKFLLRNTDNPYRVGPMLHERPSWNALLKNKEAFEKVLGDKVKHTPFLRIADKFFDFFIKDEGQQGTNSFKIRILGQFLIFMMSQKYRESMIGKTITTGTTGNQGQAVAWMVMVLNQIFPFLKLTAVIWAAEATPPKKVRRMEGASEFWENEFKDGLTAQGLIDALAKDGIHVPVKGTALESLNEWMKDPKAYLAFKNLATKINYVEDQELFDLMKQLAQEDFIDRIEKGRPIDEFHNVRLMRTLIEAHYQNITPKRSLKGFGAILRVVEGPYENARNAAINSSIGKPNVMYMTHGGPPSLESYAAKAGLELVEDMITEAKRIGALRKDFGVKAFYELKRLEENKTIKPDQEQKLKSMQAEIDAALEDWVVFVPVGAGGIAAAINIAVKMVSEKIKFVGVFTERTNSAYYSTKDGRSVKIKQWLDIIEDGINVDELEPEALAIFLAAADGLLQVPSNRIEEAVRKNWEQLKIMSEGSSVLTRIAHDMPEVRQWMEAIKIKHAADFHTGSNMADERWMEITGAEEIPEVNRAMLAGMRLNLDNGIGARFNAKGQVSGSNNFSTGLEANDVFNKRKLALRFVQQPLSDFYQKRESLSDFISQYVQWPADVDKDQIQTILEGEQHPQANALADAILTAVSQRSFHDRRQRQDGIASNFLDKISREMGLALGVLIRNNFSAKWVENIQLEGDLAERFGSATRENWQQAPGDSSLTDWFLRGIREGVEKYFLNLSVQEGQNYDQARLRLIVEGIKRPESGYGIMEWVKEKPESSVADGENNAMLNLPRKEKSMRNLLAADVNGIAMPSLWDFLAGSRILDDFDFSDAFGEKMFDLYGEKPGEKIKNKILETETQVSPVISMRRLAAKHKTLNDPEAVDPEENLGNVARLLGTLNRYNYLHMDGLNEDIGLSLTASGVVVALFAKTGYFHPFAQAVSYLKGLHPLVRKQENLKDVLSTVEDPVADPLQHFQNVIERVEMYAKVIELLREDDFSVRQIKTLLNNGTLLLSDDLNHLNRILDHLSGAVPDHIIQRVLVHMHSHMVGLVMSYTTIALGMPDVHDGSPAIFSYLSAEPKTIAELKEASGVDLDEQWLSLAFRAAAAGGLVEVDREGKISVTEHGDKFKKLFGSYGVPSSYPRVLENLQDYFVKNPFPLDFYKDKHMKLYDSSQEDFLRLQDIAGSGAAHDAYVGEVDFEKSEIKRPGTTAITYEKFNYLPLDQQSDAMFNFGSGNGDNVKKDLLTVLKSERGKHLVKRPLVMAVTDLSQEALDAARKNLEKDPDIAKALAEKRIYIVYLEVDITENDQTPTQDRFENKIKTALQNLNVAQGHGHLKDLTLYDFWQTSEFIFHERELQPRTKEEAREIIRQGLKDIDRDLLNEVLIESTGSIFLPQLQEGQEEHLTDLIMNQFKVSYAYKGKLVPGYAAAADLIVLLRYWGRYAAKHGMRILELQDVRPNELIEEVPLSIATEMKIEKFFASNYHFTHIGQETFPFVEQKLMYLLSGMKFGKIDEWGPKDEGGQIIAVTNSLVQLSVNNAQLHDSRPVVQSAGDINRAMFVVPTTSNNFLNEILNVILLISGYHSNVHRGLGQYSQISTALLEHGREEEVLSAMSKIDGRIYSHEEYEVHYNTDRNLDYVKELVNPNAAPEQDFSIGRGVIEEDVVIYRHVNARDIHLPLGQGLMLVRKDRLPARDVAPPIPAGGTVAAVTDHLIIWNRGPDKYEPGTPNVFGAVVLSKSLKMIAENANKTDAFKDGKNPLTLAAVKEKLYAPSQNLHHTDEILAEIAATVLNASADMPMADDEGPYKNFDAGASTQTFESIMDVVALVMSGEISDADQKALAQEVEGLVLNFLNAPTQLFDFIPAQNSTEASHIIVAEMVQKYINRAEALMGTKKRKITILGDDLAHNSSHLIYRFLKTPSRKDVNYQRIPVDARGIYDLNKLEALMKRTRPEILTINAASNALGTVNNLEAIMALARQYNVKIILDGAQHFSHRSINLAKWNDILLGYFFSGHKTYAPFGSGGVVVNKAFVRELGIQSRVEELKQMGQENIVGLAALGRAVVLLNRIGMDRVADHERKMVRRMVSGLKEISEEFGGDLQIHGLTDDKDLDDRISVITFSSSKLFPRNFIGMYLAVYSAIASRNGCFCAGPAIASALRISLAKGAKLERLLKMLDVESPDDVGNVLPGVVRVSFGLYNTEQEVEDFLATIRQMYQTYNSGNVPLFMQKLAENNLPMMFDAEKLSRPMAEAYVELFGEGWDENRVRSEFENAREFSHELFAETRVKIKKKTEIIVKKVFSDNAMFSTQPEDLVETRAGDPNLKGGIDFDPTAMKFETQGDAAMMNVSPQQLQQFMDAPGFEPFIINITPVAGPRLWLGLNTDDTEEKPKQTADMLWKNSLSFAVKPEDVMDV